MIKFNEVELEWQGPHSMAWYISYAQKNDKRFAEFEVARAEFYTRNGNVVEAGQLESTLLEDGDDIFVLPRLVGG